MYSKTKLIFRSDVIAMWEEEVLGISMFYNQIDSSKLVYGQSQSLLLLVSDPTAYNVNSQWKSWEKYLNQNTVASYI